MSLSTFSGHVRNLVAILDAATDRSLVLLDEVAGGTDPVEGAALAQALLARLAGQARLTVATSHYPELKEWASATEGVDERRDGLRPGDARRRSTASRSGGPGTSHALRIAERLGLAARARRRSAARASPPSACGSPSCSPRPRRPRSAPPRSASARPRRVRRPRRRATPPRRRVAELEAEIERVRASARAERERALADAEHELAGTRAELERAARRDPRGPHGSSASARRATTPRALAKERERDRRLGAASERAARAGRALARPSEPLPRHRPARGGRPGRRAGARRARDDRRDRRGTRRSSSAAAASACACRSRGCGPTVTRRPTRRWSRP